MTIKADHKYNGKVILGSYPFETQAGNCGYSVALECEDGNAEFTIWLTPKNRERAEKAFALLGVTPDDLQSATYIDNQLALDIVGKEVSFGTKEEEYNGKKSIKVAYIGKKSEGSPAKNMAAFFKGPKPPADTTASPEPPDEDVPF